MGARKRLTKGEVCVGMTSLPPPLRERFRSWRADAVRVGRSGAGVFRLTRCSMPTRYLKMVEADQSDELREEIRRTRWLTGRVPVPRVLDEGQAGGLAFFVMTEIAGSDLSQRRSGDVEQLGRMVGKALRRFHTLPTSDCPFDMRLDTLLAESRRRVEASEVDENDFDEERAGRSARELWAELVASRPIHEDLVVAHGDACLPNLIAVEGQVQGYIDLGRMGLSDRWRDLALAARSLQHNGAEGAVEALFAGYSIKPDREKMQFYALLDEFF